MNKIQDGKITTQHMIICALFTALIAIGAFIRIPVPVCPFTLQTLFVLLGGQLLGRKLGGLSALLYMILGLAGLPLFTQGGGLGYLAQPTFGYIVGFVAGAYLCGAITEKGKPTMKRMLAGAFSGLAVIYIFGMIYFYIISNYVLNTGIGLVPLFIYCFLLVVPGDIALCFLSTIISKRVKPIIKKL